MAALIFHLVRSLGPALKFIVPDTMIMQIHMTFMAEIDPQSVPVSKLPKCCPVQAVMLFQRDRFRTRRATYEAPIFIDARYNCFLSHFLIFPSPSFSSCPDVLVVFALVSPIHFSIRKIKQFRLYRSIRFRT